jgi:hypothetical protein
MSLYFLRISHSLCFNCEKVEHAKNMLGLLISAWQLIRARDFSGGKFGPQQQIDARKLAGLLLHLRAVLPDGLDQHLF